MASICLISNYAYGCPITVTSGGNPFCYTSTITLSVSGGAALESWKSSNPLVAKVNPGYLVPSGVCTVSGVSGGTTTITYFINLVPQCTLVLTVDPAPNAGAISGPLNIWYGLPGAVTFTSSGATGGTWTSSMTVIATVGAGTGVVTGFT